MTNQENWLTAGFVVRAHGISGLLRVAAPEFCATAFLNKPVRLIPKHATSTTKELKEGLIERIQPICEAWLLQVSGINDRTCAQNYAGATLQVRACDAPALATDEFYLQDLLNVPVHNAAIDDLQQSYVGHVCHVADNAGQVLLHISHPQGMRLLPLVAATLEHFDRQQRLLFVHVPVGLWDDQTTLSS